MKNEVTHGECLQNLVRFVVVAAFFFLFRQQHIVFRFRFISNLFLVIRLHFKWIFFHHDHGTTNPICIRAQNCAFLPLRAPSNVAIAIVLKLGGRF